MKHLCSKQEKFLTHKEMIVNFHNVQKSPLANRDLGGLKIINR